MCLDETGYIPAELICVKCDTLYAPPPSPPLMYTPLVFDTPVVFVTPLVFDTPLVLAHPWFLTHHWLTMKTVQLMATELHDAEKDSIEVESCSKAV